MLYSFIDYFYLFESVYLTLKTWGVLSYDKKTQKELLLIQWVNLIISNSINKYLYDEPLELILFLFLVHGFLLSNFYYISTLLLEKFQKLEFHKYYELFRKTFKVFSTTFILKCIKVVLKWIVPSEEALNDPNYGMVNQSLMEISRYVDKGDKSIIQNESKILTDDILEQSVQKPNYSFMRSQSLFIDTPKSTMEESQQYFQNSQKLQKNNIMLQQGINQSQHLDLNSNTIFHKDKMISSTRSAASDKQQILERRKSLNSMVNLLEELEREDQTKFQLNRIKEEGPKYMPSQQYLQRPPRQVTQSSNQVDDLFKKLAEQKQKLQQMKQK